MQLSMYTYDGNAINDSSNYVSGLPNAITPEADPNFVETGSTWGRLSGKKRPGVIFDLEIIGRGTIHTQREQLKAWFDTENETPKKLVARDSADSNRAYYLMVSPLAVYELSNGGHWRIQLACVNPVWLSDTAVTTNWSIAASGSTQVVNVAAGNLPARPVIALTPGGAKGGGYSFSYQVFLRNNGANTFKDYEIDLGNGLNTSALVAAGEMQASGADIVAKVNGGFVDVWLTDMNTTNTKITSVLTLSPKIEMTLGTAIASSGAISTITVANTAANVAALKKLPTPCLVCVQTGATFETFTVTSKDIAKRQLTGTARAQRTTSMAAHSVGNTIWWLELDIQLMHGNSSATARVTDDTKRPVNNLSTSTRLSKVYEVFTDDAGLASMRWKDARVSSISKASDSYSGSHGALADPATEMGMMLKNAQVNNVWKSETGEITWQIYIPAGVTTVTMTGAKRRESASWPVATLQASLNGTTWTTIWTEASPASAAAWASWAGHSGVALGATYYYLKLSFKGNLGASANNAAYSECQSATLTLDSNKAPSVTLSSKQSNYYLDCDIYNDTSGESISINGNLIIGKTLTIDCLNRTITLDDGTNALRWLTAKSSDRVQWLDLATGNNTLRFVDVGTTNVAATVTVQYRNN